MINTEHRTPLWTVMVVCFLVKMCVDVQDVPATAAVGCRVNDSGLVEVKKMIN